MQLPMCIETLSVIRSDQYFQCFAYSLEHHDSPLSFSWRVCRSNSHWANLTNLKQKLCPSEPLGENDIAAHLWDKVLGLTFISMNCLGPGYRKDCLLPINYSDFEAYSVLFMNPPWEEFTLKWEIQKLGWPKIEQNIFPFKKYISNKTFSAWYK